MNKSILKYPNNPPLGYLDINSLKNKITDTWKVTGKLSLDYFVFSKAKLDEIFPSAQFNKSNYEIRNWWDRNKNGDGLKEFVKKGLITKWIKGYKTQICEISWFGFAISKKSGPALVCIGHPFIITLSFSLKS